MTTIHDVAKLAGVSIGTVSNVLNQNKKVAPATSARVQDAIRELNYIPNTIAQSLKTSQNRVIGIIAEDIRAFSSGDIIDGLCEYFEKNDYSVNLCNLRVNNRVEHEHTFLYRELEETEAFQQSISKAVNLLTASRVSGLIYIGVYPRDVGHILPALNIPVVYTYAYTQNKDYCVNYDDYQGARLAVEQLIRKGHTRIALICGSIDSIPAHKRLMGYQNALMEHNLPFRPEYMRAGNWHYADGYQQCLELLSLPVPPTAIFSMSDLMAYGALNAVFDRGLKVPDDISIHGFDNLEHSVFTRPALSTISLPLREMGLQTARTMLDILQDNPPEQRGILIPCTLVSRGSVRENTESLKIPGSI